MSNFYIQRLKIRLYKIHFHKIQTYIWYFLATEDTKYWPTKKTDLSKCINWFYCLFFRKRLLDSPNTLLEFIDLELVFLCLICLKVFVTPEHVLLIWRRHYYRLRALINLYMAIEQWGFRYCDVYLPICLFLVAPVGTVDKD